MHNISLEVFENPLKRKERGKMKKLLIIFMILSACISQAEIKQSLGVDQSVDYASLASLGPWDDRNYQLTKADLDILPEDDQFLANVPLFYKVLARKENPNMGRYYPRVLYQTFLIHYGGLVIDGKWYKEEVGKHYNKGQDYGEKPQGETPIRAINDNEVVMDLGGAEMTIEMKPSDPMIGVAGVNGTGQSMYFTTDGAVTWTKSQDNPGASCCDPTVDWSSDSSRVYQADLSDCGFGGCNIRASFSDDDGQTWAPMIVIDAGGGSDKEFIHVDRSASSPFKDNVYITYHTGNVMQFSRSTDMGVTWSTPMAFSAEPTGIGSDITTDMAGNVYYIYPTLSGAVRMLKSIDGGATFAAGIDVAPLNGRFDTPIPAMETREAFFYVSADVDTTTDDIYVAWTDEADDSNLTDNTSQNQVASENHVWIQVAKSSDDGATWSLCTQPHDTTDTLVGGSTVAGDMSPVDRFHPWLKVGENGVVHIGYYDTRNSTGRSGVDFFYTSSVDGCATWSPEVRASTITSTNISDGFEWGDYNGLSVVLDKIAMGFTDNRPGQGVGAVVASGVNPKGSPTFTLGTANNSISVCANDMGVAANIDVNSIQAYDNAVTLSVDTAPAFLSNVVFATNPIDPTPGSSTFTFDVDGSGTTGDYQLLIQGEGDEEMVMPPATITRNFAYNISYSGGATAATTLMMPADASTGVSTAASFSWAADANATSYRLMVSDDAGFTNILLDEVVIGTNFDAMGLPASTQLYWKVATQSNCNVSDVESAVFSFTTEDVICFTTPTPIPDNSPGIDITLPVANSGPLESLLFSVKSDHTWPGDLIFTVSHAGTDVIVMDRPGAPASTNGCSQDGIDVLFDDTSSIPVEGVCEGASPGIAGTLAPEQPLAGFAGLDLSGDWVLNVSDNAGLDTGSITEFCLFPTIDLDLIFKNGFD